MLGHGSLLALLSDVTLGELAGDVCVYVVWFGCGELFWCCGSIMMYVCWACV